MEIHFEIENRCLLKCRHCSSCASDRGYIMQYTDEDMTAFLRNLPGKKEVYLTGGEPLLYPKIDRLLHKIAKGIDDADIGLFTAGIIREKGKVVSVSDKYAAILSKNGLKTCYLSVYSHCQEKHDQMTRYKGSFGLTRSSALALIHAGIEVRFNTVIHADNDREIIKIVQIAREWGASEVRLLKLIRHGRADQCWDQIGVTGDLYRKAVLDALNSHSGVNITASGVGDIIPCKKDCGSRICPAGKQLLYVTFEGEVYPCASVKNQRTYRIGNIRDKNILEKIGELRQLAYEEKLC